MAIVVTANLLESDLRTLRVHCVKKEVGYKLTWFPVHSVILSSLCINVHFLMYHVSYERNHWQ